MAAGNGRNNEISKNITRQNTNLRIETVNEYCIVDGKNQIIKDGFYSEEEAAEWLEDVYGVKHEPKSQPKIGEWIPCSKRLPEEKINPITKDFYEYQVTFQSGEIKDIRHYKFGKGHWWNGPGIMDEYVTAWKELPEAYHE